jgi:cell division protein DivIC
MHTKTFRIQFFGRFFCEQIIFDKKCRVGKDGGFFLFIFEVEKGGRIMKKYFVYFKNKFILASSIFLVYALFLDDIDLFSMISYSTKLRRTEAAQKEMSKKLEKTRTVLKQLHYSAEVERYAREEKFFKKDNEDIFVISYE